MPVSLFPSSSIAQSGSFLNALYSFQLRKSTSCASTARRRTRRRRWSVRCGPAASTRVEYSFSSLTRLSSGAAAEAPAMLAKPLGGWPRRRHRSSARDARTTSSGPSSEVRAINFSLAALAHSQATVRVYEGSGKKLLLFAWVHCSLPECRCRILSILLRAYMMFITSFFLKLVY